MCPSSYSPALQEKALRRGSYPLTAEGIVQVHDQLLVDRTRREMLVHGQALELSPTEFKLLACFLDNAGRVLTRQSLLTQIWDWEHADELLVHKI
jgi:two-component system KDP operon response regulator KdpE